MRAPRLHRTAFVTGLGALIAIAASCTYPESRPCYGEVVTQCERACTTACDDFGCYPVCWDQCYDTCQVRGSSSGSGGGRPTSPARETDAGAQPPVRDGGTAVDAQAVDGGAPPAPGAGVLCGACQNNDDCETGALCIYPGGASTTEGFCGLACDSHADCPQGFVCTAMGGTSQCLPRGGCP